MFNHAEVDHTNSSPVRYIGTYLMYLMSIHCDNCYCFSSDNERLHYFSHEWQKCKILVNENKNPFTCTPTCKLPLKNEIQLYRLQIEQFEPFSTFSFDFIYWWLRFKFDYLWISKINERLKETIGKVHNYLRNATWFFDKE